MVVADGPRNFSRAVFVLPQMNELAFTDALGFLMSRDVEAMDAHLDHAIALAKSFMAAWRARHPCSINRGAW